MLRLAPRYKFTNINNNLRENRTQMWYYKYEVVSKSPKTMLITRKSLVVHEFPPRMCCGGVL